MDVEYLAQETEGGLPAMYSVAAIWRAVSDIYARHARISVRLLSIVIIICALGTSCARLTESRTEAGSQDGSMPVTNAALALPIVAGDTFLLPGVNGGIEEIPLTTTVKGGLMGTLAPKVVPSPDGTTWAYSAWQDLVQDDPEQSFSDQGIQTGQATEHPSIRVISRGIQPIPVDREFASGAYSLAWRRDGLIAYMKGSSQDHLANVPYVGHIMAASEMWEEPFVWTTYQARYVVYGWAGNTLIAYEMEEGEFLDILAIDGPGQVRELADNASIVSISPDGTQLFVADQTSPVVRIIDVASGDEVAALDLSSALTVTDVEADGPSDSFSRSSAETPIISVGGAGSWVGNLVSVSGGPGVVIFEVADGSLEIHSVLSVASDFPWGVREPQLTADGRVMAWGGLIARDAHDTPWAVATCVIETKTCVRSEVIRSPGSGLAIVYNPSRP